MKITNHVVQLGHEYDAVLTDQLFPVDILLYKSSAQYNMLIQSVKEYMEWIMQQTPEDYTPVRGISGANLGIPWNIIGIVYPDGNKVYLNPMIHYYSAEEEIVMSNCGSLRLPEPIPVRRSKEIFWSYYDMKGERHEAKATRREQGFTIQHEIDHNQGILITDPLRAV